MRNPRLSNLPTPFSPSYRQPVENVSAPFVENPSQKPSPTPPKSPFPLLLSLPLDRHPNPSTGFRSMEYPVVLPRLPRGCRCLTLPRVKHVGFQCCLFPYPFTSFCPVIQVLPSGLRFRTDLLIEDVWLSRIRTPPVCAQAKGDSLCCVPSLLLKESVGVFKDGAALTVPLSSNTRPWSSVRRPIDGLFVAL